MISVILFYLTNLIGYLLPFFYAPIFAFTLYQLIYYFHPEKRWWGVLVPEISYSFFAVLLMLFVLLININLFSKNKILSIPQFKWAYFLVFLYGIAYFYAISPVFHLVAFNYFLKLLIIITIAYKLCNNSKHLDNILYGHIIGAWYMSFYIFQIGRNSGSRVEGVGTVDSPDANGIAATLAPVLVLCLYNFLVAKNNSTKLIFVLAGVFIADALVLINSRGAFLGAASSIVFFLFYMYFSKFQRKHQKKLVIFIIIAGLAGSLYLMDDNFKQRMFSITKQAEVDSSKESGGTRMIYWMAAWEMAKDYPFGNGYRGFNHYSPIYIPANVNTGRSKNRSVHSTWFETLSEVGYLGLFSLCLMLYYSYSTLNKCKKILQKQEKINDYFKVLAIQAALIAFIVSMTFLNRMRAEVLYWIILYSACAYNIYVVKEETNQDKKVIN